MYVHWKPDMKYPFVLKEGLVKIGWFIVIYFIFGYNISSFYNTRYFKNPNMMFVISTLHAGAGL